MQVQRTDEGGLGDDRVSERLRPRKSTPALAVVVGAACSLAALTLPLLVEVSSRVFGLSAASAGRVTAAEMFGFTAGAVVIYFLLSRVTISRLLVASLLVLLAGNLLTIVLGSEMLLPLRFVTGLGEGGGAAAATAIFADTATPERYFGILLSSTFIIATALFRFDPRIVAVAGPYAMYWILAAVGLLALPAALFVRKSTQVIQARVGMSSGMRSRRTLIIVTLAGIIIYFAAWTTTWAYAVNIGRWSGLSIQQCDVVLSNATLAAIAGAGLAVMLGPRLGNILPLLGAGTLMAAAAILIIARLTPGTFPIAILAWMGGIQFAAPYMVAVMSQVDHRAASLSVAAQTLGMSIGPSLAATVVGRNSAAVLASLSIALLIPSLIALLSVAKVVGRAAASVGAGLGSASEPNTRPESHKWRPS